MAGKRSALIVASDTYQDPEFQRLRAPGRDAEELAAVLRDENIGGFDAQVSFNERHYEVRAALERFFLDRGLDDVLLVHFSCHGIKDDAGRLFFAASDTQKDLLNATGIAAEYVNDLLNGCRSKHVVLLLDCCYSGAFARDMRSRGDQGVYATERFQGRGRAVITASNALEYAWEGDTLSQLGQPSIFTSAVVRALRTGEADRDQDGYISVDELYDYVFDEVRRATPKQTPGKWADVEGPLFVARSVRKPPRTPDALPPELLQAVKSPFAGIREGAIVELGRLLQGPDASLARAAEAALEDLAQDDSRRVSDAATKMLSDVASLRHRSELAALYADAQVRYQAGAWQEALGVLGRIRSVDPSYPGLEELEVAARRQLAAAEGEHERVARYGQRGAAGPDGDPGEGGQPLRTRRARLALIGGGLVLLLVGSLMLLPNPPESVFQSLKPGASATTAAIAPPSIPTTTPESSARRIHWTNPVETTWATSVYSATFSPDANQVVAAAKNGTALMWDWTLDPEHPRAISGYHSGSFDLTSVDYSSDERTPRFVTTGADGAAHVWGADGTHLFELDHRVHGESLWSAAFSWDGGSVVTVGSDHLVQVWDLGNRTAPRVTLRHNAPVWSAAFNPSGTQLCHW